jgi:formate hydrogenlyase transcriptional activator
VIGLDTTVLVRAAIETSPNGVVVVACDGRIVLANAEAERLFGYRRGELNGQPVDLLLPDAARLTDGRCRNGCRQNLLGRRHDGSSFVAEAAANALNAGPISANVISIVDLTERRRVEAARQSAVERQRAFERFIAELSGQLIDLPLDRIDGVIRTALGRICRAFELDRGTMCRISATGALFDEVSWAVRGVVPMPAQSHAQHRFPWAFARLMAGERVVFSTPDEIPSEPDRRNFDGFGTRSAVIVPLRVKGQVAGAAGFHMLRDTRQWSDDSVHQLTSVAAVFEQVLARRHRDEALQRAVDEVERLKDALDVENTQLRREARCLVGLGPIVGNSPALEEVLAQAHHVAATNSTVLLLGETGVGKELLATQIHALGPRRQRQMVRVNCAAIPETLIESELFGRERGAFTGALSRQIGRFELASGSSIFLDEIGDFPAEVQVKLLRVLEKGQIERLGCSQPMTVDARVIATTHRNLEQRVASGSFRKDLFYRLNVFPIRIPPLRERPEDIPLLVWRFVEEFSKTFGKRIDAIADKNMTALCRYSWPGNIRELRNVVERAMIAGSGPRLSIAPPPGPAAGGRQSQKLVEVEREHILSVLESTGWRIRGHGGAADRLGLKPTTLETRMAKLGLKRPDARA